MGMAILLLAGAAAGLFLLKKKGPPPPAGEEFKVLTMLPQGEEVPISTEGATVMFNRAAVPLTTLDAGRDRQISLSIHPAVNGKFFWLGTRGFIFRPETHFDPSTTYRIKIPDGVKSIEGYPLDKSTEWSFSTVRSRVIGVEPERSEPLLLPSQALLLIRFNLSMDRADVERKLTLTDVYSAKPVRASREFTWLDDDHLLQVHFRDRLPWGTKLKLALPAGIKGAKGDLGSKVPFEKIFLMPPADLLLSQVLDSYNSLTILPETEFSLATGQGVCFYFNQPVETESFEKAFRIDSGPEGTDGKKTYFFYREYTNFPVIGQDGKLEDVSQPTVGCASFAEVPSASYRFSLDMTKMRSVSGAKPKGETTRYVVKTEPAEPFARSTLTKNIFSQKGVKKVPYEGVNLASAVVRLYRLKETKHYSESVKDATLACHSYWDENSRQSICYQPLVGMPFNGTTLSVPLHSDPLVIDQGRMKADFFKEIPISLAPDKAGFFQVDLDSLPSQGPLGTGLYLIETIGVARAGQANPKAVYTMVQVTPVAIAIKREVDHLLVWATDIETGEPVSGIPVSGILEKRYHKEFIRRQEGTTNEDGVAILKGDWSGVKTTEDWPYDFVTCVEAGAGENFSYSCEEDHAVETSYDSVLLPGPHYFAYLYTDRPIYRPGQTVYYSMMLREVREGRYFLPKEETTFDLEILDAAYEPIFSEKKKTPETGGIISGKFELKDADDIPRGNYHLKITAGRQTFEKIFVCASYRKPTFKVELTPDAEEIASGDPFKASVKGSYFFGAPVRKGKVSWSIMTESHIFSPEGYETFSFIDTDLLNRRVSYDEGYGDEEYYTDTDYDVVASSEDEGTTDNPRGEQANRGPSSFFKDENKKDIRFKKGLLDDEGRFEISYKPDLKNYPVSQVLSVESSVTDPAQQEVSAGGDVIVHKGEFYLGIRPEKWAYAEKEKAKMEIVSLDWKGSPVGGKDFVVEAIRREYQFIERRNARGYWDWTFEPKDTPLQKIDGETDSEGKASFWFEIPQGGEFRFFVKAKDKKGNEIRTADSIYAWGGGYVPWRLDKPQEVELIPDKDSYMVGETAKILVKSLLPVSKALVTYERGRVLDYRILELGGGNANHIEVPVTEGMIPNMTVGVVVHAGRGNNAPPMLFHGETELIVDPEKKRLRVELVADRKGSGDDPPIYRPGEQVTVKVTTKDSSGQRIPAHVMVSVADESVLSLLDYQLPDLIKKFFYRRTNRVLTSSSLISLKAGDGGVSEGKKRRIFKDTAHFEGHLITNEHGEGEFSFTLPDDLTTWVIEALGVSNSKTFEEFEEERETTVSMSGSPDVLMSKTTTSRHPDIGTSRQTALDTHLSLTDNTFVGGSRAKIMTTLPVVLRPALPRFAVWGDEVTGKVIAVNRNSEAVSGELTVSVEGDATVIASPPKAGEAIQSASTGSPRPSGARDDVPVPSKGIQIPFQLGPGAEKAFPVTLNVRKETGHLKFSAEAREASGVVADSFEVSLKVLDRYAPEVVATSGVTKDENREQIDIPKTVTPEKGGISVALAASLGAKLAPTLKKLVYFPYGCSEQKSATLLALLMTRQLSLKLGEKYFDAVSPLTPSQLGEVSGLDDKIKAIEKRATDIMNDLQKNYRGDGGGIVYWSGMRYSSLFPSVQTLWALSMAQSIGIEVDLSFAHSIRDFVLNEIGRTNIPYSDDTKAYGLWVGSLFGGWDRTMVDTLIANQADMSVSGVAYLSLAIQNNLVNSPELIVKLSELTNRLTAMAKHDPRSVSWPSSSLYWSSADKNTALAAMVLLKNNPQDPLIPKALAFLLNRKKREEIPMTQNPLHVAWIGYEYSNVMEEGATDFAASVILGGVPKLETKFDREDILSVYSGNIPMAEITKLTMPADTILKKSGDGTLYYDLELKYYLPPDQTPTREEGLVISREYYALDDVDEKTPLTEFKGGENYRGHIVIINPKDRNYIMIEDLLPAGFEPIDMTLATTSRAAATMAAESSEEEKKDPDWWRNQYDDVIASHDFGMNYAFPHQEVHDDAILWSDVTLPPGTFHIRYPVRATTAGRFVAGGARAFEFYNPEVFGRSRARTITIH